MIKNNPKNKPVFCVKKALKNKYKTEAKKDAICRSFG